MKRESPKVKGHHVQHSHKRNLNPIPCFEPSLTQSHARTHRSASTEFSLAAPRGLAVASYRRSWGFGLLSRQPPQRHQPSPPLLKGSNFWAPLLWGSHSLSLASTALGRSARNRCHDATGRCCPQNRPDGGRRCRTTRNRQSVEAEPHRRSLEPSRADVDILDHLVLRYSLLLLGSSLPPLMFDPFY